MHPDTSSAANVDAAAALNGILALLIAEREPREGAAPRRTERILAGAGLSDDQIAALTGRDARQVRATIDADTRVANTAWGHSVIDRARASLTDRAPAGERSTR